MKNQEQEARDVYVRVAIEALEMALNVPDLEKWFKDEKEHREKHRVIQGTPEYAKIVAACSAQKAGLLKPLETAA